MRATVKTGAGPGCRFVTDFAEPDLRPGELALVVPLVCGLLFLSAWPAGISNHSFFGPSPTAAVKSGFK